MREYSKLVRVIIAGSSYRNSTVYPTGETSPFELCNLNARLKSMNIIILTSSHLCYHSFYHHLPVSKIAEKAV